MIEQVAEAARGPLGCWFRLLVPYSTNAGGWSVRIFPIRTVSEPIRFGVDPVRYLSANHSIPMRVADWD